MELGSYLSLKAVNVTWNSCAEQSQIVFSPCRWFVRLPTGTELGSYPLLELLLSREIPVQSRCRLLYLLVFTSWDPLWPGWSSSAISYQSCYCHKKLLRGAVAEFYVSSSILLENLNWDGVGQLSPLRAVVVVTWRSCAGQLHLFVSPRKYLLRLATGGGVRQLSPIRADIFTRKSCTLQSQIVVCFRWYFLTLPTGM